jgi:hypothetical protein
MLAKKKSEHWGFTYNLGVLVFVSVGLHVPDDLMSEQLGEFGRLNDVSLNVAKNIVSERLHNLRNVEKGNVYGVALQRSHRILNDERMIPISRQEICHSRDWVDCTPIEEVLFTLASLPKISR